MNVVFKSATQRKDFIEDDSAELPSCHLAVCDNVFHHNHSRHRYKLNIVPLTCTLSTYIVIAALEEKGE